MERHLWQLHRDLISATYRHGGYTQFMVTDSKRRSISVASIRDRVVHRLLYECLTPIYEKTFIFDAWSCRKNKGLVGAIERTQQFLTAHPSSFIWRADITKFFDSVDQSILLDILCRKISDHWALYFLDEVIRSYFVNRGTNQSERERVKKGAFAVYRLEI